MNYNLLDMPVIIAFIGRAGSGKDYQCSLLQQKGFIKLAFADSLRQVTAKIARIPYKDMLQIYDDFKAGDIFPGYTGRELMENIGSAMRGVDPNIWINGLINSIKNKYCGKNICISDLRYVNEYMALFEYTKHSPYNLVTVFCDYHSDRYQEINTHESAHLSNWFAQHGYKDLTIIDKSDIEAYILDNQL